MRVNHIREKKKARFRTNQDFDKFYQKLSKRDQPGAERLKSDSSNNEMYTAKHSEQGKSKENLPHLNESEGNPESNKEQQANYLKRGGLINSPPFLATEEEDQNQIQCLPSLEASFNETEFKTLGSISGDRNVFNDSGQFTLLDEKRKNQWHFNTPQQLSKKSGVFEKNYKTDEYYFSPTQGRDLNKRIGFSEGIKRSFHNEFEEIKEEEMRGTSCFPSRIKNEFSHIQQQQRESGVSSNASSMQYEQFVRTPPTNTPSIHELQQTHDNNNNHNNEHNANTQNTQNKHANVASFDISKESIKNKINYTESFNHNVVHQSEIPSHLCKSFQPLFCIIPL
jgi:hypothetical protein